MKIIRTFAYLFGAAAVIFGAASCDKDDDDDVRCCTYTYDGESVKLCENGEEFKLAVEEYGFTTWEEFSAFLEDDDSEMICD